MRIRYYRLCQVKTFMPTNPLHLLVVESAPIEHPPTSPNSAYADVLHIAPPTSKDTAPVHAGPENDSRAHKILNLPRKSRNFVHATQSEAPNVPNIAPARQLMTVVALQVHQQTGQNNSKTAQEKHPHFHHFNH